MIYHKKLGRVFRLRSIAADKTDLPTKSISVVQGIWQLHANKHEIQKTIAHAINYSSQEPNDQLDKSLKSYADKNDLKRPNQPPLHNLPFDESTAISGNLWHNGNQYYLAIKGGPEQIIAMSDLTENEREKATMELRRLTARGLRVIALAHLDSPRALKTAQDIRIEPVEFDGFVALITPPDLEIKAS